jgi:hypothetical protein
MDFDTPEQKIEWLEQKLAEARQDRDEVVQLVNEMREHLKDADDLLDSWIEVFDMSQDERGVWIFDQQKGLFEDYARLQGEHRKLIQDWNKFVGLYNGTVAPKPSGRPLAASETQIAKVKDLRKAGHSLRAVAKDTGLSLRTVRTIIENDSGTGRKASKAQELRRREFARLRAAAFRARKKKLDALPKQIDAIRKDSARLMKAAKGLTSQG